MEFPLLPEEVPVVKPEKIIIIGASGSGKSTVARQLVPGGIFPSYIWINFPGKKDGSGLPMKSLTAL